MTTHLFSMRTPMVVGRDVFGRWLLRILMAVAATAVAVPAFGTEGEVHGRVLDLASGRPIENAYVRAIPAAEPAGGRILQIARAGKDGRFVLSKLDVETVDLVVGAQGYTETTLRGIAPGAARELVVRLFPSIAEAASEDVVITAKRARIDRSPTVSSHRVERGVVDDTPGSLEDVTRAMSLKPGIVQVSEFAPVLFVRGGDAYQTYFFLDDVLIYNPFQPIGGGTIFNPDLVQSAEIYTGGQLASFPEALSGLISIDYKEPETDRIHGYAEASVISVNTRLEGGLDKTGAGWKKALPDGWLLSARRSDYEPMLFLMGAVAGDSEVANPYFLDLFAKGTWNLSPRDHLAVNAMYVRNSLTGFTYKDEEGGREDDLFFDDQQRIAWLRWTRILGDATVAKTNVSRVADRLRANSTGTDPLAVDVDTSNLSLRTDLSYAPEAGTAWDAGIYLNSARFELKGTVGDFRRLQPGVAIGGDLNLPLTELFPARSFSVGSAYVQYKRTLNDRLTVQPGARISVNDATHEMNVGPRVNASWRFGDRHVLKGAWGMFHQPPFNPILLDPDFGNPRLRSERSIHYVAGYEGEPFGAGGTWLKAEAFYKDVFDQVMPQDFSTVDFERPSPEDVDKLRNPFMNAGRSDAWGAELSFRRELSRRLRVEANYSYLEVETVNPLIENPANRRFPPYQDQRHTLNLVANWRVSDLWTLSMTSRLGSGKPYTPIESFRVRQDASNDLGARNIWVPDQLGALNGARYPAYARIDLRAERTWRWREARVSAYLEIINAQIRRNTEFINYTAGNPDGHPPVAPERKDILGLPTLPFVGIKIDY